MAAAELAVPAWRRRHGADCGPIHASLGRRTAILRPNTRHHLGQDEISTAPYHSTGRKSSYGASSYGTSFRTKRVRNQFERSS